MIYVHTTFIIKSALQKIVITLYKYFKRDLFMETNNDFFEILLLKIFLVFHYVSTPPTLPPESQPVGKTRL